MKPIEEQTLVERLRIRAQIRRQAKGRKSVEEGKPDRISDLLEEAANTIEAMQREEKTMIMFSRVYDGESMVDIPRDVEEAFDPVFNDSVAAIQGDENGFLKGRFEVTIKWIEDDAE